MSRYPYGKQCIIDQLSRKLDEIEKTWPMAASYERVEPYIIPMLQGDAWFEFIVYHIESKLWFDKSYHDAIVAGTLSHKLIQPSSIAFDLGCNSGAVTLPMAMLAGPEGHVHAFDPYPWNAAATQATVHLNHFHNVTVHAVGLSNRSHEINVSPIDSRIYSENEEGNSQKLVIRHIKDYMHLRPQSLKIDIEGAEHELFDVNDPQLYGSVDAAALEFHPMWLEPRGIDCRSTLRNIQKCGLSLHYYSFDSPPYDVNAFASNHHFFWLKRQA
jgi:FkbM family methyltransferase